MKNIQLSCLFVVFCLLLSCSKGDPETPPPDGNNPPSENPEAENPEPEETPQEVYFTLNVLGKKDENSKDEWIVTHNDNGDLLDFQRYVPGEVLQFEAEKSDLREFISVSELRLVIKENGSHHYRLFTHTNVPVGSEWEFGGTGAPTGEPPVPLEPVHNFELQITDIPGMLKLNVSTNRRRLFNSLYPSTNGMPYTFSEDFNTYENEDEFFVTLLDGSNNMKYYTFTNAGGNNISIDYSEFAPLDRNISVILPDHKEYYLNIAGFEQDEPFSNLSGCWLHDILHFYDTAIPTDPLVFGYLDRFEKYRTLFSIQMEEYTYAIVNYGAPLNSLEVPQKPLLNIITDNPWTFDYSVDLDYLSADHGWTYKSGTEGNEDYTLITWGINTEMGQKYTLAGGFPEEIFETYPRLNLSHLEYATTRYYFPVEGPENLAHHQMIVYKP